MLDKYQEINERDSMVIPYPRGYHNKQSDENNLGCHVFCMQFFKRHPNCFNSSSIVLLYIWNWFSKCFFKSSVLLHTVLLRLLKFLGSSQGKRQSTLEAKNFSIHSKVLCLFSESQSVTCLSTCTVKS